MITTLNEWRKMNEEANFPAQFGIDDAVSFVPMFKHQELYGIAAQELEGTVVAVRFSKAKVFYDIVDDYFGKLFDEVASDKVGISMWTPDHNAPKLAEVSDEEAEKLGLTEQVNLIIAEKKKMSKEARKFISDKIKFLIDKEGKDQKQAIAMAYSFAKKDGLL